MTLIHLPAVTWLATVQARLRFHCHGWALPQVSPVHLVCGGLIHGHPRVWGDLLCGISIFALAEAKLPVSVGYGYTAPGARHVPCPACTSAAAVFPDVPIAGPPFLADPVLAYAGSGRVDFPTLTHH